MPDLSPALRIITRALRMTAHRADTAERDLNRLLDQRDADHQEITRLRSHLADVSRHTGTAPEIEPGRYLERCVCGDTELVGGACESMEFHAGHLDCTPADAPTLEQFWTKHPTAGQ